MSRDDLAQKYEALEEYLDGLWNEIGKLKRDIIFLKHCKEDKDLYRLEDDNDYYEDPNEEFA